MTNREKWSAEVFWSDDDDGFIAVAKSPWMEILNVSAFGTTREDALRELEVAVALAIKEADSQK